MKVRYCIFDGKDQYLSTLVARLSGKNGGRIQMSFTEKVTDRRSPPLTYELLGEAKALLSFACTQLPESTEGFEVVEVTVKSKNSITIKRLDSGLTTQETGSLT